MMLDELIELLTAMREGLQPLRPLEVVVRERHFIYGIVMVSYEPAEHPGVDPGCIALDCHWRA